jgi:hypothetical protein
MTRPKGYGPAGYRPPRINRLVPVNGLWGPALRALWWVVTLPFRLLVGLVALFGRVTAFALGFVLMVVGVAFGAGPLPVIGIPLFVVGLILVLRALE